MNPQPPLLTITLVLIVTALLSAAIGWVRGWLARGYQNELDSMTERRRR